MQFLTNGKVQFTDYGELYYHLFMEMGLSINQNQYLYDQDTGAILQCKEKYLKAFTDSNNPIYAGKNDIIFDPSENFSLINYLFGYFLDKYSDPEFNPDNKLKYIAHYTDNEKSLKNTDDRVRQRIVIKADLDGNQVIFCTEYYYCLYLAYIEAIFVLNGNLSVDLRNFDILKTV